MIKEMIVSSNDRETAVAILEDDQVVEFFIERENQQGVVGNVYKGRVSKVLPGMQSSFIDLGLERDGFLYVSDVLTPAEALEDDADEPSTPAAVRCRTRPTVPVDGDGRGPARARPQTAGRRGRGAGRGQAAIAGSARSAPRSPTSRTCSRKGRTCWCRWPRSRSAPRAPASPRTSPSPAASWCSCRPSTTSACRARSSRARSGRACAASSSSSARAHGFNGGVIIRTAAANRPDADILGDLEYFHQVWKEIQQKSRRSARPRSSTASRASSPSCSATC